MTTDLMTYPSAPLETVIVAHGPFQMTPTGVTLVHEPTFEEWLAVIEWAQDVDGAVQFWLGDLIEIGERCWGDKYTQALQATEYSYQSLRKAAYVARQIPKERRRPPNVVSYGHHEAVAALPPAEQDSWLQQAEDEHWTRDGLRARIRHAKADADGKPVEFWLLVRCTDPVDQETLADKLRLEGRQVKSRT